MAKYTIIAARPLQILGHEGTVEAGTVLATIETDCEYGSLISSLQFGHAIRAEEEEASETEGNSGSASPPARRSRPSRAKATAAPAGDGAAKSSAPTTNRRRR